MIIKIVISALIVYLIFLFTISVFQKKLIFVGVNPDYLQYDRIEKYSVPFHSNNVSLQGWGINGAKRDGDIAIFFGGNAQDVSQILPLLMNLNLQKSYTFNYRGYGLSEGQANEKDLYKDAEAIYDFVQKQHPESNLVIFGQSLGSAVAGYVAHKKNPAKIILITPLSSVVDIVKDRFHSLIPEFLITQKLDLISSAKHIDSEVLMLIADQDMIVPNKYSLKTFDALAGPKKIITIPSSHHNDITHKALALDEINRFLI